jgi:hypothetical protein
MKRDFVGLNEGAGIGAELFPHDVVVWRAKWQVDKFRAYDIVKAGLDPAIAQAREILIAGVDPYAVYKGAGNLLMYGGASCLWQCLIGNGTASAGQALTYFNNAQAALGVGDSSTAAVATQTDLQAVTNKLRKAMDATYPVHTDATSSGAASIQFKSTFATGDANFAWEEWIVANSATNGTGRALNRKVESLGTKTSAASWAFTVTLTLA